MSAANQPDHWDSETYSQKVAPFVPALTEDIVSMLDARKNDYVLDLGCGDGVLTRQLANSVASITGIDSSANMIAAAQQSYSASNTTYLHLDAVKITDPACQSTLLSTIPPDSSPAFTKIFSNAALHWILRPLAPPPTASSSFTQPGLIPLVSFFRACHTLLTPGGLLVTECGGLGNVAEVHTALISALIHRGIQPQVARSTSPWFFPSAALMRSVLVSAGFIVEHCELVSRPTELPERSPEGWVRLFAKQFLDKVAGSLGEVGVESVVSEVVQAVEGVGRRVEDGSFVLGYVRLRVRARKPAV